VGLIDFSLGDIGNLFTSLREAITGKGITDPTEKAKIELQLEQLENGLKMGQIKINEAEASNPNWFVSGWRPFIGWVGGSALAYEFIFSPLIQWGCNIYGLNIHPPVIDGTMLFNLVIAMLGLGGMRTFEKIKNVQDKH